MSQAGKALIVFVVAAMGLWGCAQGPANSPANAERIKALETKLAKLEDDFRAAVSTRDTLRKKLTTAEDERTQLAKQVDQLQQVVRERDDLKAQVALRISERDSVQSQFDQFRKGIKNLLGQVEPTSPGTPVTAAVAEPTVATK